MKIWLLTTEFPPFFGGGIGTYCCQTCDMLTSRGHQVTVFVGDNTLKEQESVTCSHGARLVRFKPTGANNLGYVASLSWDYSEIVERYLAAEDAPDIIETQDYLGIGYYLLQKKWTLWPRLQGVPVIVTLHTPAYVVQQVDHSPTYRMPNFWTGEMEKFVIRAADAVVAPSRFLLDRMRQDVSIEPDRGFVVRHPFAVEIDQDPPQSAEKGGDILFLGRLQYLKGVLTMMDAMSVLWDEGLENRLILVGNDTWFSPKNVMMSHFLRSKYQRYFNAGLVTWEGNLPPLALRERIKAARLTVMPSLFEAFSYAVVESMAAKKIVVASDNGGQRELIEHGRSGFLFAAGNPQSLRAQIAVALSLSASDSAKIGIEAGRRVASLCSYDEVFRSKSDVIETAISKSGRRRDFPFVREPERKLAADPVGAKGLLSIVVPYHNMGTYVEETVKSLTRVTYEPKELIIVDDGSSEPESIKMLSYLEANYSVRVLRKPNGGVASARNVGAKEAHGEFLAFLDPDDLVEPEYHEWAIRILRRYENVGMVGCWLRHFGAGDGTWPTWNSEPPFVLVHNTMATSSLVFRRAEFLRFGVNDMRFVYGMEDYDSLLSMVENGYVGVVIPKPLFKWRSRPESLSHQFNRDNMAFSYDLIARKHANIFKEYVSEVVGLLNANGPGFMYDNPSWDPPSLVQSKSSNLVSGPLVLFRDAKRYWKKHGLVRTVGRTIEYVRCRLRGEPMAGS